MPNAYFHRVYPVLTPGMLLAMLPANRGELIDKYGIDGVDTAIYELRKTHEILTVKGGYRNTSTYELVGPKHDK